MSVPKPSLSTSSNPLSTLHESQRSDEFYRYPSVVPTQDGEYPVWFTRERIKNFICSLPNDPWWNAVFCIYVLTLIVFSCCIEFDPLKHPPPSEPKLGRILYIGEIFISDIPYIFHVSTLICNDYHRAKMGESRSLYQCGYILDIISILSVYIALFLFGKSIKTHSIDLVAVSLRMHRPIKYLGSLNHYLKGSIIGTLFKFFYLSLTLRIFFSFVFYYTEQIPDEPYKDSPTFLQNFPERQMFLCFYKINKIFMPLGPESYPKDTMARFLYVVIMLSGVLLVFGIGVASLSLIICLYMRPEEEFRSRFRLIMDDMKKTQVPLELCKKVETFYRMFWRKQKAVSVTELLPTYPRCLNHFIRTNVYFEALQKSRVTSVLSNQLLGKCTRYMETIHYIPGDLIVKRNSMKSAMIFINHGDVALLSAEDDDTALLRFTRGTILNSCGVCGEIACTRSYVAISAATFCTAHVLKTKHFWKVANKYRSQNQSHIIHNSIADHLDRVKMHFKTRVRPEFKYKSSIMLLKRSLVELKKARDDNGKLLLERADMFINIAGCYVMRNQEDMSFTEETDEICLRPTFPCILQPNSSLVFAWNFFVFLLTVVVVFVHPYYLVHVKDVPIGFRFFNHMVSAIYILDIIVHLSTGTKVEEGVPLTFIETSSQQMKSFTFVICVISVLPIFELIGDGHYSGINKLARLPQIFHALKQLESLWLNRGHVLRFCSFLLMLFILTYLVGTLKQFYSCTKYHYCVVNNFTHSPYWAKKPIDDGPVAGRLVFSMYYAISLITYTTHKTAEFGKQLFTYQIFVLVSMELCTLMSVLIEATYSATITVDETLRDRYKACIDSVKTFLVKINMDPTLRRRFIDYLELCWYTDKAYAITHKKQSILFDLPPHVNEDILAMQHSKHFLAVPIMKFLPTEQLKKISSRTRLFYTAPHEILLNTGDICNEIHVIKEGICEAIDPVSKEVKYLLHPRSHFGDIECLLRLPAYYTIRTATHVRLYSFSKEDLDLEESLSIPKIKDAINYAKELPEYSVLLTARKAFLHYVPQPHPPNLERFPIPRKHIPDCEFLSPFNYYGYFSVLRYVFPRFTIRPDGRYLKRYQWFRCVCAICSAMIFPTYNYTVLQFPCLWHFTLFLDFSAYLDIIQRTLVGYFDRHGILIYHPVSTCTHYIKGAFLVDLLACLPMEYLDYVRTTIYFKDNAYMIPSAYTILMYNRLLQIYRVLPTLDTLNEYFDRRRPDIVLMVQAIPVNIALVGVVTSLALEYSINKWRPINGGWRLELIRDPTNGSWIETFAKVVGYNITATPLNAVLTTTYWVVYESTSTGFNLFHPDRIQLIVIFTVGVLLGFVKTTYYSVRVISIRSNVNTALANFQEHMRDIITYMKKEKFNENLQRRVTSHYDYLWDRMGGTDHSSVLKLCDQISLRTDAILHIYGQTFSLCPILPDDVPLLRNVGRAVKSTYMKKSMTIIERDDVISEMYVVHSGIVKRFSEIDDDLVTYYLPPGSVFGNLDNLNTVVCRTKFQAGSKVHLLEIKADKFHIIIEDFPIVKTLLNKYRPNEENFVISDQNFHIKKQKTECLSHELTKKRRILNVVILFFDENKKVIQILTILICMSCVYGDLYNASWQDNSSHLIALLYTCDICFYLTIVLKFTLPFMAKNNTELRKDLIAAKEEYIKKIFRFDIISCIPIECLSLLINVPSSFAILRLNRCFRLICMHDTIAEYYKHSNINLTATTIASVAVWFMTFVHTASCIWNSLGVMEDLRVPKSSWRHAVQGMNNTFCDQYICALYFIVTTFTLNGVGDILPQQPSEVIFVVVLMILSTLIFMIYVGEFSNIIHYRYCRYFSFYSQYLQLLNFLVNNKVAQNLIKRTSHYTLHLWQETRGRQTPFFLESAPRCLRLHIMSTAYMHHLTSHPIFKDCESSFLRQLVGHFRLWHYSENQYVVLRGDINNSMYFIHKGLLRTHYENVVDGDDVVYKAGQHFGMINGLLRDIPFNVSYKSVIKSQVLILCFDEWEYLLQHFRTSKNIIDRSMDHSKPHKPSTHAERIDFNQFQMKNKHSTAKFSTTVQNLSDEALNTTEKNENNEKAVELSLEGNANQLESPLEGEFTTNAEVASISRSRPFNLRRSTAAGSTSFHIEFDDISDEITKSTKTVSYKELDILPTSLKIDDENEQIIKPDQKLLTTLLTPSTLSQADKQVEDTELTTLSFDTKQPDELPIRQSLNSGLKIKINEKKQIASPELISLKSLLAPADENVESSKDTGVAVKVSPPSSITNLMELAESPQITEKSQFENKKGISINEPPTRNNYVVKDQQEDFSGNLEKSESEKTLISLRASNDLSKQGISRHDLVKTPQESVTTLKLKPSVTSQASDKIEKQIKRKTSITDVELSVSKESPVSKKTSDKKKKSDTNSDTSGSVSPSLPDDKI